MMMAALKAGGMEVLTDGIRIADRNNPKGYFEFERVKKLPKDDFDWLDGAKGKAVKIISTLLPYLPENYRYRIIFMKRDLQEILSSQQRMLERSGKSEEHPIDDADLLDSYNQHLDLLSLWLAERDWIDTLYVNYNQILAHPCMEFTKVANFLNGQVDAQKMSNVVDRDLYRERERDKNIESEEWLENLKEM
jgi:hypothetical protein